MYLKSIEVQGFKSFAQKINFEFHNGITGIVGPNGSGKSNVSDAVRWVLGEQSAKQLRGGSMQDVIFSGTELRRPLSFASVAITLDNADHSLPLDYQEVTVTRRLYRSGESEYLLNGASCRLKDINELFYDTGIGKEGYSLIGQGQIDRILSGKPEERRYLFDEAAGIVKFKRRKNEALKNLEAEEQNLVRVTDILSELTRQIGPLKRQSETARKYLDLRETLKGTEINLFLLNSDYATVQLKDIGEREASTQQNLDETNAAYEETKSEYDRLDKEMALLGAEIDALREDIQKKTIRRGEIEGEIKVLEEQILSARRTSSLDEARRAAIEADLKSREEEKASLEKDLSSLKDAHEALSKDLSGDEEALRLAQERISGFTKAIEDGKKEQLSLLSARADIRIEGERSTAQREQLDIENARVKARLLTLNTQKAEQEAAISEAEEALSQVNSYLSALQKEKKALEESLKALQDKINIAAKALEERQKDYNREAYRLESLRNMAERYDGYGSAIRRCMEQKSRIPGIHGVVADLISVEQKYETAIETALGGSIQNIVTDTDEVARQLIEFLKANKAGRATFLPLKSLRRGDGFSQKEALKEPGAIALASALVKTGEEYRGLMEYLLGRILVVDSMKNALPIARKYHQSIRMVTLEGELISPGGAMTGGAFKNSSNLLGRKREIEDLEKKVDSLKTALEAEDLSLRQLRDERNGGRDTLAKWQERLQTLYVEQNTALLKVASLKERTGSFNEEEQQILKDQEALRKKQEELAKKQAGVSEALSASETDEKELADYIGSQQAQLEQEQKEEAQILSRVSERRLALSGQAQKEDFARENLSRLEKETKALILEKQEIDERSQSRGAEEEERKAGIKKLRQEADELLEAEDAGRGEMADKQAVQTDMKARHRRFFDQRDSLARDINLLEKECLRLKSQREKLEESREADIAYLWEEYEVTPHDALSYKREDVTDKDRGKLKKQAGAIKDEIRALGSVNVNAIEDYKDVSERHEFLSAQYEDLQKSKETLEELIRDLDDGMRKQFTEKFKEIQREYDKAFKELFGGGRGTLELAEGEDILEAGINITSQPPGKKLQNMMQLSGGEKALSAIALLFAIQNLKPSPFCLLDEIEAALDDSNVGRFASYLQKLSKNTQFIVITHRRGTMVAADRLYGITMQEKGVSTLVSVDLVENQLTG